MTHVACGIEHVSDHATIHAINVFLCGRTCACVCTCAVQLDLTCHAHIERIVALQSEHGRRLATPEVSTDAPRIVDQRGGRRAPEALPPIRLAARFGRGSTIIATLRKLRPTSAVVRNHQLRPPPIESEPSAAREQLAYAVDERQPGRLVVVALCRAHRCGLEGDEEDDRRRTQLVLVDTGEVSDGGHRR